jgi:iron-sulfur cluster assembly accessory protein
MGQGQDGRRSAAIKNTDIVRELSLPPVKIHCSVLAEDAIKAAIGMILDYEESLMHEGFVFQNPNAKKSCGCGSSFS